MSEAASGLAPAAEGKLTRRPDAIALRRQLVRALEGVPSPVVAEQLGVTAMTVRRDRRALSDLITLQQAERETEVPRWVLTDLIEQRALVAIPGARRYNRQGRLVSRLEVETLVAKLRAAPATCEGCGEPCAPGREWHRGCVGLATTQDVEWQRAQSARATDYWSSDRGEERRAEMRVPQLDVRCWFCKRTMLRRGPHVRAASKNKQRPVCEVCRTEWLTALGLAGHAAAAADPHEPTSNAARAAFAEIARIGEAFDHYVMRHRPAVDGHPPAVAMDIVIEALVKRGFSDPSVTHMINDAMKRGRSFAGLDGYAVNEEYVKTRRKRRWIIRRLQAPRF